MLFLLAAPAAFAQATADTTATASAVAASPSIWSSPLFWVFVAAIIGLLFVIIAIGSVLVGLVNTKLGSNAAKAIALLMLIGFSATTASAQAVATPVQAVQGGLEPNAIIVLLVAIGVELFVIIYLYSILQRMLVTLGYKQATPARQSKWSWAYWYENMTKAIPVEKESEVATDHNYDGIRELDNSLPPWWVYMFYATIAFAFVYVFYYHFSSGPLQEEEYNKELELASIQKTEQLKKVASNVDENTVVVLTEAADLAKGKSSYITKCAACHGQAGEGGVGPNLTDEYWIHGGGVSDIFKTIKYGVQEKGMIAWQAQMQPTEMQQVTSFVMSLQGTNPANGKAAQGVLYVKPAESAVDSNAIAPAAVDSTTTVSL
jgi:cytochrome c oxidase cbb3-type subunit 3